ncbi:MAG: type II secretion system F family protein [Gammaproteobacteria bacterium]|nr:type II secretion system F family protein [Gammaproteobacteria bacterium]
MRCYFLWYGINQHGKLRCGLHWAADGRQLRTRLIKSRVVPHRQMRIPEAFGRLAKANAEAGGSKQVPALLRQLATLSSAGIPLVQALEIIRSTTQHRGLAQAIDEVIINIASGQPLATSLRAHPQLFDAITCNLIQAGEQASALEPLLGRVAQHAEQQALLRQKVQRAMRYPLLVLSVASAVSLALLLFVVPRFAEMFGDFGAELPAVTARVLSASEWLQSGGWQSGVGIGLCIFLTLRSTKYLPGLSSGIDKLKLRIPLFGAFQQRALIARLTRTLALMLQAGMPLSEALPGAAEATSNQHFLRLTKQVQAQISSGRGLADALSDTCAFPARITQMIAVGEETGALGGMLERVADHEEKGVEASVDSLGAMIEPLLMVFLGVVVGGLVLAMYLPVFQMGGVF